MKTVPAPDNESVPPLKIDRVLKKLLSERNVTAREVSRATGVPQSTLASLMSGKSSHKPEQILSIARYFGISMETLLFGFDEREPSLSEILTEDVFQGWVKVRIERAIPTKRKVSD